MTEREIVQVISAVGILIEIVGLFFVYLLGFKAGEKSMLRHLIPQLSPQSQQSESMKLFNRLLGNVGAGSGKDSGVSGE